MGLLTPREQACMSWVAVGKTSREIAAILNISARTVDYHINNACSKLLVNNRHSAVTMALKYKQIPDISHLLPPLNPTNKEPKKNQQPSKDSQTIDTLGFKKPLTKK